MNERAIQNPKIQQLKSGSISSKIRKNEFSHQTKSTADRILFLQRTAGNQAVQRLISSGKLQAKLRVGPPGDKYEREADKIAERAALSAGQKTLHTPPLRDEEAKKTLRRAPEFASGTAITSVGENFVQKTGAGQPIAPSTRSTIEPHLGADLGSVRVHSDTTSHEAASSLNARAFTYKSDIYLGRGESQDNLQLMAHEAAHVVQQGAVVQRSPAVFTPAPASIQRWDVIGGIKSLAGKATEVVGGAIGGAKDWVLGKVAELVVNIPGFFLLCVMLGRNPVTDKPVERNAINLIQGILGLIPGGEAIFQNLQKSGAIEQAFAWLNDQIAKLNLTWESIKGLFRQAWASLSATDVLSPSKAFEKVKNIFAPPLERIKNFAVAAGKKILDFIFEGVLKLAGPFGVRVLGIIRKAGDVISTIINDPIGFLKNLIHAVRKGFDQFSGNILTHLKEGLMKWLFGALSDAGLVLPEKFDLMGILSIVLQVLGLTYDKLRGKLVKVLGETPVKYIEKAFEFLYLIVTKGLAAAWEKFLEFIGDLKEMVISAIRDWVVVTIVKKAITKLVSMFNPVGAIVQAIIMVYDTVTFFIERFKQIMELAEAVFDSIANIAAGKLDAAANYVEKTMARTIPVIIGFLAGLIGLGGISAKIKKIIEGIQAKVDMALDKIVNFIVTKAKGLLAKGKMAVAKGVEKIKAFIFPETKFKTKEESHRIWIDSKAEMPVLMISSKDEHLDAFISALRTKFPSKNDEISKAEIDVKEINETLSKITKEEKDGKPVDSLYQTLLKQENELAIKFKSILDGTKKSSDLDIYKLEGMVATYGTMPRVTGDKLTPDHQPQKAVIKVVGDLPEFTGTKARTMANDPKVNDGIAINIYSKRHEAGRTWGTKGSKTKEKFENKLKLEFSKLIPNDKRKKERKDKAIELLDSCLGKDVKAMTDVYNDDSKYDDIKNDPKLVADVKRQGIEGLKRIRKQDLNSLK